jgi:hypothetical protein
MKYLFLTACVVSLASSTSIEGILALPSKVSVPDWVDRVKFFSDARVVLVRQGTEVDRTGLNEKGFFKLNHVKSGSYIGYVVHPFLRIDPVSIEVSGASIRASTYDPLSGVGNPIDYPLKITASAYQSPYTAEEEFNAFQIFKNPMVIMGLLLVGLVWLMPKVQGGVSPDDMREMRKGLAEENSFAANFLKNMIPADSSDNASQGSVKLPSLTLGKKDK